MKKLNQKKLIAPPLELLFYVKTSLISGRSVHETLESYVMQADRGQFVCVVEGWLQKINKGEDTLSILLNLKSTYRQILLEILELGIKGEPILTKLCEFEKKLNRAIDDDLEKQLKIMPLYSLLPLLFLQLPSLMMIGFLPFVRELSLAIGS